MQGWFSNFSSYGQSDEIKPHTSPAVSSTSPKQATVKREDSKTSEEFDDFSDLSANQLTAAFRRTTTLMRTSLDSLEVKLNTRIEELESRCSARLDKLEMLTASLSVVSVDGSPGQTSSRGATSAMPAYADDGKINNLTEDVQTVVDAIRLEILNVKRQLGMLDEMPRGSTSSSFQPLGMPVQHARQSTTSQQAFASKTDVDYIVQEMSTRFQKLQEDLESIKDSQEQAGVKACYLALSAADLTREEKELMFERLKTNENRRNQRNRSNPDDVSDYGSGIYSLRSKAS